MGIIIRNDDVNPNTDYKELMEMYDIILESVPDAEIWTVWSPVCKQVKGSSHLYPKDDYPLKQQPLDFFFKNANRLGLPLDGGRYGKIASHGMLHFSHKNMPKDAQKMSIVTSCVLLNTKIFVPPFSEYDANTEAVCSDYGIRLVKCADGWKSLESEPFNPDHPLWFFHSWRYTPETFREIFKNVCTNMGKLS